MLLQLGGMGFIHYNNTLEEQVAYVSKVKRHVAGMVVTPVVMKATDPISKIDAIKVVHGKEVCYACIFACKGRYMGHAGHACNSEGRRLHMWMMAGSMGTVRL